MHTFVGWNRFTSSRMVYGGQHVCRRSGLYSQQPERRQPRFSSSCHSSGQKLMASRRRSEPDITGTAACHRRLRNVDAACRAPANLATFARRSLGKAQKADLVNVDREVVRPHAVRAAGVSGAVAVSALAMIRPDILHSAERERGHRGRPLCCPESARPLHGRGRRKGVVLIRANAQQHAAITLSGCFSFATTFGGTSDSGGVALIKPMQRCCGQSCPMSPPQHHQQWPSVPGQQGLLWR